MGLQALNGGHSFIKNGDAALKRGILHSTIVWPLVGVLFFCSAMYRYLLVEKTPISIDEFFSWAIIQEGPYHIFTATSLDVHPPLYYWILWCWAQPFGDSIIALRAMSVFFGLLSFIVLIFVFMTITRESDGGGNRLSDAVAWVVMFSLFRLSILGSTAARMYSMGGFLCSLSILQFACLYRRKRSVGVSSFFLGCTMGLLCLTHNFGVFIFLGGGFCILCLGITFNLHSKACFPTIKLPFLYVLGWIAIYVWWIPILLAQTGKVATDYWITSQNVQSIARSIVLTALGHHQPPLSFALFVLICITIGSLLLEKRDLGFCLVMLILFLSSFLGGILFQIIFNRPILVDRYLTFASYYSIVFIFLQWKRFRSSFSLPSYLMLAVLTFLNLSQVSSLLPKGEIGESSTSDFAGAVVPIVDENDTAVFVGSPIGFFELQYYWKRISGNLGDIRFYSRLVDVPGPGFSSAIPAKKIIFHNQFQICLPDEEGEKKNDGDLFIVSADPLPPQILFDLKLVEVYCEKQGKSKLCLFLISPRRFYALNSN